MQRRHQRNSQPIPRISIAVATTGFMVLILVLQALFNAGAPPHTASSGESSDTSDGKSDENEETRTEVTSSTLEAFIPPPPPLLDPSLDPIVPRHLPPKDRPIISACIVPLYGGINAHSIGAWLKYYNKRWAVTHTDIYIRETEYEELTREIKSLSILKDDDSFDMVVSFAPYAFRDDPYLEQLRYMNKCLYDAKVRGSLVQFCFDIDEYLVSSQYTSFQQMFEYSNHTVITFPVFGVNVRLCSRPRPTFGSTTYRGILPIGSNFSSNATLVYTDPPSMHVGHRKFVLLADRFYSVRSVHQPDRLNVLQFDFTGREVDQEDIKLLHYRFQKGIQAELGDDLCSFAPTNLTECPYLYFQEKPTMEWKCTSDMYKAELVHAPSEVTEMLNDAPLNAASEDLYQEAACYAKRYTNMAESYCPQGIDYYCNYRGLSYHWENFGKKENLIFGCNDE